MTLSGVHKVKFGGLGNLSTLTKNTINDFVCIHVDKRLSGVSMSHNAFG